MKKARSGRFGLVQRNRTSAIAALTSALGADFAIVESFEVITGQGAVSLDVVVVDASSRIPIVAFKLRKSRGASRREAKYDAALIPWRQFDPASVAVDAEWVRALAPRKASVA